MIIQFSHRELLATKETKTRNISIQIQKSTNSYKVYQAYYNN